MNISKISLLAFLLIILVVVFALYYVEFFSKVVVKESQKGPYVLAYREHIGDYKGTRDVQDEIYDLLLEQYDIVTYKGFGLFMDDPKVVPKEKLRSLAGCILEEKDYDKIEFLREKGVNVMKIEKDTFVTAEFPMKASISGLIGVKKVHPKIEEYIKTKGYENTGMMEIYDVPSKKIIYLMSKERNK